MPPSWQTGRPWQVRRLGRRAIAAKDRRRTPDRGLVAHRPQERQQRGSGLGCLASSVCQPLGFLFLAELIELKIIPELAKSRISRVPKQGRQQNLPCFFLPA
jgi:hypothetical protein